MMVAVTLAILIPLAFWLLDVFVKVLGAFSTDDVEIRRCIGPFRLRCFPFGCDWRVANPIFDPLCLQHGFDLPGSWATVSGNDCVAPSAFVARIPNRVSWVHYVGRRDWSLVFVHQSELAGETADHPRGDREAHCVHD